jgi:glycosyltransferase involved in cell wall biosynthesis
MASGVPIIASNVPGLNNVVENAGLLFSREDDKELAEMIDQLLLNKDLYDSLVQKGLRRAEKYSIELTASRYIDLYKKIL